MDIRFQIKKMVRSLQYRVAFLISSLCVCVALLLETWKNRGVDRLRSPIGKRSGLWIWP